MKKSVKFYLFIYFGLDLALGWKANLRLPQYKNHIWDRLRLLYGLSGENEVMYCGRHLLVNYIQQPSSYSPFISLYMVYKEL